MLRVLLLVFLLSGLVTRGQGAKKFPEVLTEKVNGGEFSVPTDFNSTYILIGVGTSKKAEEELRTWQNPVYNKFIAKTGLMDDMYEVEVCFLPLFTGASKAAKPKIVSKLKENNESVVVDHLYIYTGDRATFKSFGIKERTSPYFYLIDDKGAVLWEAQGRFKQSYFNEIEEILNQ